MWVHHDDIHDLLDPAAVVAVRADDIGGVELQGATHAHVQSAAHVLGLISVRRCRSNTSG